MIRFMILPLSALFIIMACHKQTVQYNQNLKSDNLYFVELQNSEYGGVGEDVTLVYTSKNEFNQEWNERVNAISGETNVPNIDFSTKMVIAKHFSQKRTGGHELTIENIRKDGDDLLIIYAMKQPKMGDVATDAITNPYFMVEIPKINYNKINYKALNEN